MTAIHQGIETTTWHDQRPTHPRMSTAEFDARRAEEITWRRYDDALEVHLAIANPTHEDYENLDHARKVAEQASHELAMILHAKHHFATETPLGEQIDGGSELDF